MVWECRDVGCEAVAAKTGHWSCTSRPDTMFLHGQPLLCQLRSHLGQNKIFLHMGQNIAILGPVWYFSLVSCKKNNLILYFNWPKHIIGLHGKFQVKYYILALLRTYSLRHFRLTSLFTFCFHALVSILAYFRKLLKLNDHFQWFSHSKNRI